MTKRDPDPTRDFDPDVRQYPRPESEEQDLSTAKWSPDSTKEIEITAPVSQEERTASHEDFGDYELLEEIARGGMGIVYRARQKSLKRIVALKMILSGELADKEEIQRFRSEAEAAAKLDHPGIVPVYEVGQHNGQHYFSMGFVDGDSLQARATDGPLPPMKAASIVRSIAEAVAYAHEKGVLHRDLKPGNVLQDAKGQVRITDFGLAKQLGKETALTATGRVMGTPSYMPPEQAQGKLDEIDVRADVYALGAILYFLITGQPPFKADNLVATLKLVVDKEPVSPRQQNSAVDRDLETICLKCLEKESYRRYSSAAELQAELERYLNREPIHARPVGKLGRSARWLRRNPSLASVSCLLVVAMIVAGAFALRDNPVELEPATLEAVLPLRWNMDLRDKIDSLAVHGWDSGIGRHLYGEISTVTEAGQEGEWLVGWGLARDGLARRIQLSTDGSCTITVLTIEEAQAEGLSKQTVSRSLEDSLITPMVELVELHDVKWSVDRQEDNVWRFDVSAVANPLTQVELREVRAALMLDFVEGDREGEREIRSYLKGTNVPEGILELSFLVDSTADQRLKVDSPARLRIEAFALMGSPQVYQISHDYALPIDALPDLGELDIPPPLTEGYRGMK